MYQSGRAGDEAKAGEFASLILFSPFSVSL